MAKTNTEAKPKAAPKKEKKLENVTLTDIWEKKMDLLKLKMAFLKGEEKDTNKFRNARKEIARMWTKFNNKDNGKA